MSQPLYEVSRKYHFTLSFHGRRKESKVGPGPLSLGLAKARSPSRIGVGACEQGGSGRFGALSLKLRHPSSRSSFHSRSGHFRLVLLRFSVSAIIERGWFPNPFPCTLLPSQIWSFYTSSVTGITRGPKNSAGRGTASRRGPTEIGGWLTLKLSPPHVV